MERGKLYLVATPIGNLADITLRALDTLKQADVIACEDTRRSAGLLNYYQIRKQTVSYYMHKERESGERILALLAEGKSVALITDAGMPCVSDPGAILVSMARAAGYEVTVVPGASAVVSAMALSGITRRGFCFLGFLPERKKDRDKLVGQYKCIDIQLVFYSAPHNLNEDLEYLYSVLGERKVYLVKEITKMFENVTEGDLSSLRVENPRGEYVIILEGREQEEIYPESIEEHLRRNLALYDKKQAVKITAKERGVPKDDVYKIAIDIK